MGYPWKMVLQMERERGCVVSLKRVGEGREGGIFLAGVEDLDI